MKQMILMLFFIYGSYASSTELHSVNNEGKTVFEAVGKPAMIKIKGEGPGPDTVISFTQSSVNLVSEILLDTITTGIDMRDEHMREKYLEVKKYPKAKLTISSLNIPVDWDKNPTKISEREFTGSLNLHGKDSPIKGIFSLNDNLTSEAEFKIKLTDYNIEIPEYLGIKVADMVTVKTKLKFEKK
jgi:polyisoprenoid-binding protein YceI